MKTRIRTRLTAGCVLAAGLAIGPVQGLLAQRNEPVGRILGDLGRPTAVDRQRASVQASINVETVRSGIAPPPPPPPPLFAFDLLPSGQGSSDAQSGGLQLRATNGTWIPDWSFIGGVKDKEIHTTAVNRNQAQVDLEVDPSLGPSLSWLSLSLTANYSKRFTTFTSQEYSGECDVTILHDPSRRWIRDLSSGAVVYYDHSTPDGGASSSGSTVGVTSGIGVRAGTTIAGEYDLRSDFNGEDYTSVRVSQQFVFGAFKPTLIVGGGKHNIYSVALKLPLNP